MGHAVHGATSRDVTWIAFAGRLRRAWPSSLVDPALIMGATVAWLALGQRRRTIATNIEALTGIDDPRVLRRRSLTAFRNFAICNADMLELPALTTDQIRARVAISGLNHLTAAMASGRGALLVGPHLGNFEFGTVALASMVRSISALVESIDPARDALFASFRRQTGLRLIPVDVRAPRAALGALRRGDVLLVAGDRALRSSHRATVPFGCRSRLVPTGPAWLALRARVPVLTGYVVLSSDAPPRYQIVIDPPVSVTDLGADPVLGLTQRIAERLGGAAARFADQWFVFDPEWQLRPST